MAEHNPFQRAKRSGIKLRMALVGPTGSGKTMWGIKLAEALAGNRPPAVIDSEQGSAKRYADMADYDVAELTSFMPQAYTMGIKLAEENGYQSLLIDSLSHAWMGKDGALAMVDRAAGNSRGNSFAAWREVTPHHNALIDAMLSAKLHLIVTMRAKTEYVLEQDDRGKMAPKKVGLQPVQRDGLEYEFDIVADVDMGHNLVIGKTRCAALDGCIFAPHEFRDLMQVLSAWLNGDPMPTRPGDELRAPVATEPLAPPTPTPAPPAAEVVDETPSSSAAPAGGQVNGFAPVPDDEFTKDDDEPFDEPGEEPAKSDPETVRRLMGCFDHCYRSKDFQTHANELDDAYMARKVRPSGTSAPALEEAKEKAKLRVLTVGKLALGFEKVSDVDGWAALDADLLDAQELKLLRDGTEAMQVVTARRLCALARVTTGQSFKALESAVSDAANAGNLVEGDLQREVMAALTEAEARCAETMEA